MKNHSFKKRGLGIALSFVLFIGFAFGTISVVHAGSGEKTIAGFGTSIISNPEAPKDQDSNWVGSYVYFGTYNGSPMKYRVLDNNTGVFGGTTMLLDCDSILYAVGFDKYDGGSNVWNTCQLRSELNSTFLANSFSGIEQGAIAASVKANPDTQDKSIPYATFAPLTGEKIFVLDAAEVTNTTYGYGDSNQLQSRTKTGTRPSWWLRSPLTNSGGTSSAATVGQYTAGVIVANLVYEKTPGVSPALNIDLSKILFLSVVDGTAGQTGASYKMTLLDSSKKIQLTGGKSVTYTPEGVITVPYTYTDGATADAEKVNRISYMITDKTYTSNNAQVLAYGALQNIKNANGESSSAADAATGTGTFVLSSDLINKELGKDYHLYIFAEHVNDTSATDYACSPVEITVFRPAHNHTWTYSASGNEVKAYCVNTVNTEECSYQRDHALTVSVTAADALYSGKPYQNATKTDEISSVTGANVSGIKYYSISEQGAESDLAGAPVNAGKYKAKVTVTSDNGIFTAEQAFRIDKASITPTVSITGWTYGTEKHEPSVTGNTGNGTVTFTYKVKGASDSTYTENVPVNAGEYTIRASVAETDNYKAGSAAADFTINPAAVTVSGITAKNKTYDGNDTATLDYSGVTFAGKLEGDTLTVTAEGNFDDAKAGVKKNVVLKNFILAGADKDNYVLAAEGNQASAMADIEKKEVDAVLTVSEKAYDGKTNAQVEALVNQENLIPGDSITISGLKGYFVTADAGDNKIVNIDSSGKSITGTGVDNYNVKLPDHAAGAINKAPLTVTARANTIIYGDEPADNGVEYSGFVNDETANVLGGTLKYSFDYNQFDNVGNRYKITPTGLTSVNYDIHFVDGILAVGQKEISIQWDSSGLTYNGNPQIPKATVLGTVGDDVISLTLSGEQTNANAGTETSYTAAVEAITGAKAGNYKLPADVTKNFTIDPKEITASMVEAQKEFLHTGEIITPSIRVKDGENELSKDEDYVLSGDLSVIEVGSYMAVVEGKGNYTGTVEVPYKIDDRTAPSGKIKAGTNEWTDIQNNINFDEIFYQQKQTVTITGEDGESGVDKIYYFLSSSETVMGEDELAELSDDQWTELKEGSFDLYPDNKYVVYAKIMDKSGNITFVSSNGIVLDSTAPVIAGIENEKTYCGGVTFTVSDNGKLKIVKIDGRIAEVADNGNYMIFAGDQKETHAIEAEDKAGNISLCTITLNAKGTHIFSDWEEIKPAAYGEDGVRSRFCLACGLEETEKIKALGAEAPPAEDNNGKGSETSTGTNTLGTADTSDPTSMVFIMFLMLLFLSSGTMAVMILRRKRG